MTQHRVPKGTKDIYGPEIYAWRALEDAVRALCEDFGYGELRTPMFEHTELFEKATGETTDVVQKEMYTFETKGKESLTLKPEGTPATVRAFLEHGLYAEAQPTKLFYLTPLFRYEQPQAGRMRQFHSFGAELFGVKGPAGEAELIALAGELFRRLGLSNLELQINSLGGGACRKKYNGLLKEFLAPRLGNLCPTCRDRYEKNPLRVLDCKEPACQEILQKAPTTLSALDTECREHFEGLQGLLTDLAIPFQVNPKIVRGLDYYVRTVFEFISKDIGAQATVCGGGRYDPLLAAMGGPDLGAAGFGMGLERILLALESRQATEGPQAMEGRPAPGPPKGDVFIGWMGPAGCVAAQKLALALRRAGFRAEAELTPRSVKAQMKYADKTGAEFSLILGDDELAANTARVKRMATGQVETLALTPGAFEEFLRKS